MELNGDFHNEVGNLFDELNTWRMESQKRFSDIIELYRGNVTRSHNNLLKEVENLHSEVSTIRKERNVLLETVDHLNNEIRQFNAITQQVPAQDDKLLNQECA